MNNIQYLERTLCRMHIASVLGIEGLEAEIEVLTSLHADLVEEEKKFEALRLDMDFDEYMFHKGCAGITTPVEKMLQEMGSKLILI